jgi:hypothetical protein
MNLIVLFPEVNFMSLKNLGSVCGGSGGVLLGGGSVTSL